MKSKDSKANAVHKSPTRPNVRQPLPHEHGGTRANAPTRPPLATQNSKTVQRKPSQARPATTPPRANTPAAPPVYRPQPTPAVLQRKEPAGRPQVRATQTPPHAASNVTRRPAAPPVYRPQSAPKVLQAKPALPRADAPSAPKAGPRAGFRPTPAPPTAPRVPTHPASRALHAQPARLNVLQRMEDKHGSGSGSDDEEEELRRVLEEIEAQEKGYRKQSQNQKAKLKSEKDDRKYGKTINNSNNNNNNTTTTTTTQSSLTVTTNHLGNFSIPNDIFGETLKQKKRPKANQVSLLAKVNGTTVDTNNNNTEHDNEITSPSTESCVTNTTGDGEVGPLVGAMRSFLAHLKRPKNQKTPQNFTIALFGFWGACDGCKRRLIKFVQVWEAEARRYMKTGVAATLRITYQYSYPAEVFERDWGKIKYGWDEDGERGPCFHTIEANVTGTNDKV